MASTAARPNERLLTADELAVRLGVKVSALYNWRYRGEGPRSIKVGKYLRYKPTDVDAWLEQQADPQSA